jgi:hypothetical protein
MEQQTTNILTYSSILSDEKIDEYYKTIGKINLTEIGYFVRDALFALMKSPYEFKKDQNRLIIGKGNVYNVDTVSQWHIVKEEEKYVYYWEHRDLHKFFPDLKNVRENMFGENLGDKIKIVDEVVAFFIYLLNMILRNHKKERYIAFVVDIINYKYEIKLAVGNNALETAPYLVDPELWHMLKKIDAKDNISRYLIDLGVMEDSIMFLNDNDEIDSSKWFNTLNALVDSDKKCTKDRHPRIPTRFFKHSTEENPMFLKKVSISKIRFDEKICKEIDINTIKKKCYTNSMRFMFGYDDDIKYIEGFAYTFDFEKQEPRIVLHGWNKIGDKFIDLTSQKFVNGECQGSEYYVYLQLDCNDLKDINPHISELPPIEIGGFAGWQHR